MVKNQSLGLLGSWLYMDCRINRLLGSMDRGCFLAHKASLLGSGWVCSLLLIDNGFIGSALW
jgi:hypothetical protein